MNIAHMIKLANHRKPVSIEQGLKFAKTNTNLEKGTKCACPYCGREMIKSTYANIFCTGTCTVRYRQRAERVAKNLPINLPSI